MIKHNPSKYLAQSLSFIGFHDDYFVLIIHFIFNILTDEFRNLFWAASKALYPADFEELYPPTWSRVFFPN